ncbi:MAG: choice-of-anchor L domain-containing protein [Bacteroidota bacterium]
MTRIFIQTLFLMCSALSFSQLQTNSGMTPQQLVQNVLVGQGVTVSNVFYSGANDAIGTFDATNANVGIDEGVIMTTGTVLNNNNGPHGPNDQDNAGIDNGETGYGPLENLVDNQTFNATVLEFDFVPFSDTVRFNYVFASEEYPEYVGEPFNDVFAFFISGPGINGAENMAIIPGTTQPVAINNVNAGSNAAYYVDNGDGNTAPMNNDPTYIQYDGFTTPLEAVSKVECGETYHIIMAIADVADPVWDSGIFLEKNGFTSEQPVSAEYELTSDPYGDGETMAQGCTSAEVTVTRSGDLSQPLTVPLSTGGSAIEGTDYSNVPNSVNFAAGQDQVTFTIDALNNTALTGTENILLIFDIPDPCGDNNEQILELFIRQVEDVAVSIDAEEMKCPGDDVQITANATGGGGGYTYQWSNGATTPSITVSPASTETYTVTVTDDCLNESDQASTTVDVPVFDPLVIDATDDIVEQCPYVPFTLNVEATGGAEEYSYQWTDDFGNTLSSSNSVNVKPSQTTTYTVTVTDVCGNEATEEVTITILSPPLLLDITPEQEICPGDSAYIQVDATGGFGDYYYEWTHSDDTTAGIWVQPDKTTSYTVIVMDDCQTFDVRATTEVVVVKPDADFRTVTEPRFIDIPITFQNLTDNGVTYEWSFGDGNTSTMTHPNNVYNEPGVYEVELIATDRKGCTDTTRRAIEILDEFYIYVPNSFTPDGNRYNNYFEVSTINVVDFSIEIFNRWGELIFTSTDPDFKWDGTHNGQLVPDGTYVWKIKYSSVNSPYEDQMMTGHVTVLR